MENTRWAYVGLGSNSVDAWEKLAQARKALADLPDMALGAVSSLYCTEPQEYADQPWFWNQVVRMLPGPSWRPCAFVDALMGVEATLGRARSENPALRFGPRTADLDLLLFGRERSRDPHCLVPHPRMTQRAFVLVPLREIAPHVVIDGLTIGQCLERLDYRVEGQRIFQ